ncbi:MAG: hypothetical protein FJ263_03675 [Planctomycetes bacterium]|nr:hypothetical protein [Planctomycetota bacterium]
MRNKILGLIAFSVMATIISGCATNQISLADKGLVSVKKHDGEKVKILWTDVYQQAGQTWAYGVLKQRGINPASIKTHVDIQVLNPDGSIRYETITDNLFVPRKCAGKGPDWKGFRVQLPNDLPKDSQISMTVHSGGHEKSDVKS